MKPRPFRVMLLAIACIFAFTSGILAPAAPARAALQDWHMGVSIRSRWDGDFGSGQFKQSVDNAAAANVNYISLVLPYYQSNIYSTDVHAGGDTPTDGALTAAIDYIHSKGIKVMLKPHLESSDGRWRADINPSDRGGWFANYGNTLRHLAQIAKDHNVESLCVGTELISMAADDTNSTNTQNWKNLIGSIRSLYSGQLTYSANWGPNGFVDEKNHIQFWDALDFIGISAYYNLYSDNSIQGLKNAWDGYNQNDIKPLSQKWNKPVVFTEIGYKSVSNSHTQPWDYNFGGGADETEQANDYQALFDYWSGQSFMHGVHLWEWDSNPNAGGAGDAGYTPQHKQAENVMRTWFSGGGVATPGGTPNFTVSSSNNPSSTSAGQTVDIASTVTNSGQASSGNIVDVEVYNSATNQQVLQRMYENQTFGQGQAITYHSSFTLPSNATYTVKIGVFNYSWSTNYVWVDNAGQINGSSGSGGSGSSGSGQPPPSNLSVDIWWPTSGSHISGIVPFKAMVQNLPISDYDMYWQVDGGGQVFMPDNQTDWPHKEFTADVTNWTWNGNGPYHLNFIAKDKSGKTILERAVDIYIP